MSISHWAGGLGFDVWSVVNKYIYKSKLLMMLFFVTK